MSTGYPATHSAPRFPAPFPAHLPGAEPVFEPPAAPRPEPLFRAAPVHDFETHVLHLVAWPQLARLPASEQATVARLCALLARRPTAGSLVPVLLKQPRAQVFPLIAALRQSGHLLVSGEPAEPHPPAPVAEATPPTHSLLEPLWRRLGFHL